MRFDEAIYQFFLLRRRAKYLANATKIRGCVVISVGNLTSGGTGKTPMVQNLARGLQTRGRRVAVVSRGHGGTLSKTGAVVSDGKTIFLDARAAGDEPILHARSLPGIAVVIGQNRVAAAEIAARDLGCDTIILDDGFQFWSLQRDFDVVLLDALRPFGNGFLLPRGRLREPIDVLKRADAIVLTRANAASPDELAQNRVLVARAADAPIYAANHVAVGLRNETGNLKSAKFESQTRNLLISTREDLSHHEENRESESAIPPRKDAQNAKSSTRNDEFRFVKRAKALQNEETRVAKTPQMEAHETAQNGAIDNHSQNAARDEEKCHLTTTIADESAPREEEFHVGNADENEIFGLEKLRGLKIGVLSAIADNSGFIASLRVAGAEIVASVARRDHHAWNESEVRRFVSQAREKGAFAVVTTEKDAVKIGADWCAPLAFWSVALEMKIVENDEIWAQIERVLSK